ncbi:GAF domain-containing protein [Paenibacillus thiaminolyticus]|uniref:GAF domain-containing protein n=1 Tax=Paenibacillus thiaminolyticus TaxID=49283 RepID=A0A3A3GUN7_PANTH|nr:GAF domain-containing protein [Paenibacillus thiaminolyticus]RJG21363.1 GAF domain-containing protein [Paenibacillus thiaminolyticus]
MKPENDDEVRELLGNSTYIPFLHRIKESWLSLGIKWVVNFIIAVVDFINLPAFVFAFLFFFEQVIQQIIDKRFTLDISLELILWFFGAWLLLRFLMEKTRKNIVSPTLFPIWFMNSKGILRNWFFSIEMANKYNTDLDTYVKKQADEYIRQRTMELENHNLKLQDLTLRLSELHNFPNEAYEAFGRCAEMLSDFVIAPAEARNDFDNVLDRILVQLVNTKPIQRYIKQASILLYDEGAGELTIAGQFNISNSVVRTKVIKYGERFAGKVIQENKVVWIRDVNSDEAKEAYDFSDDVNRSYIGIVGYPFGIENRVPYGIICLHFIDVEFDETEKIVMTKTLEAFSQFVIASINIKDNGFI